MAVPALVVLDRDGVINQDSDAYIKSPEEWIPIPGSLEAIARLNHAGIQVAVASNQSGIGRGLFAIEDLNAMHAKLQRLLARVGGHVDAIFFCPHTPDAGCNCRKPRPGLLHAIAQRFELRLRREQDVLDLLALRLVEVQAFRHALDDEAGHAEVWPVFRSALGNGA